MAKTAQGSHTSQPSLRPSAKGRSVSSSTHPALALMLLCSAEPMRRLEPMLRVNSMNRRCSSRDQQPARPEPRPPSGGPSPGVSAPRPQSRWACAVLTGEVVDVRLHGRFVAAVTGQP